MQRLSKKEAELLDSYLAIAKRADAAAARAMGETNVLLSASDAADVLQATILPSRK